MGLFNSIICAIINREGVNRMTIEQQKLWSEGRKLWFEYVRVNGYSFTFNNEGIKKLSRSLDLKQDYIRKRLNIYLEN